MNDNEQKAESVKLAYKSMFQSLVANFPGAVYRCANDPDWTMEFISDYIKVLSGFPASDFIQNQKRSYASIIHPNDVQHVEKVVQEGLETDGTFVIHYRIIQADGSPRWVYEQGRGVRDHKGQLVWLDGAILDDTQRKQAEETLEKSKSEIEKKVKALEQLNSLMIGREVKMADLKKEVDMLLKETGKPPRYH